MHLGAVSFLNPIFFFFSFPPPGSQGFGRVGWGGFPSRGGAVGKGVGSPLPPPPHTHFFFFFEFTQTSLSVFVTDRVNRIGGEVAQGAKNLVLAEFVRSRRRCGNREKGAVEVKRVGRTSHHPDGTSEELYTLL